MREITPESVKTICVNGFGLIGDLLMRMSFIETLASLFPNAKITLLIDRNRHTLVENHPNVDKLIIFDRRKKPRWAYIKNFCKLITTLRKARYDIFFNLYGGGSSNFITLLSGAKYRIGFYRKKFHKYAYTHPYRWPPFSGPWPQEFGLLLERFGIQKNELRNGASFYPRSDALNTIQPKLSAINKPLVLFNMGSGDPKKTWAVKNYASIAQYITEKYHCHIGVFINPGQEYLATELKQFAAKEKIADISFFAYDDFSCIGALMTKARYMITGDTGLMFIAFGVKLPVIGIFTKTHPDYVVADDSPAVICYAESASTKDDNNKPYCTNTISVPEVKRAIDLVEAEFSNTSSFDKIFLRLNQNQTAD